MAISFYDRVKFYTGSIGQGAVVAGPALSRYRTPVQAGVVDGAQCTLLIEMGGGAWEVSTGVWNQAAGTFTRVLRTSSTGALLVLDGTGVVTLTAGAAEMTTAFGGLGFVPVNKAGDTMSGNLSVAPAAGTAVVQVNGAAAQTAAVGMLGGGVTGNFALSQQTNGSAFVWNGANGPLVFGANNAERMRIDPAGKVGIGGASTQVALEVRATGTWPTLAIKAEANQGAVLALCGNGTAVNTADVELWQDAGGLGYFWNKNNAALTFGTNNLERMRIDAAGNLGIGTFNPAVPLHVNGQAIVTSTTTDAYLTVQGSAGHYATLALGADGRFIGGNNAFYIQQGPTGAVNLVNQSAQPVVFLNGGAERMRIDAAGKVGIGTWNPGYPLHVQGNAPSGQVWITAENVASVGQAGFLAYASGGPGAPYGTFTMSQGGTLDVTASGGGPIRFITAGVARASVDGGGMAVAGGLTVSLNLSVTGNSSVSGTGIFGKPVSAYGLNAGGGFYANACAIQALGGYGGGLALGQSPTGAGPCNAMWNDGVFHIGYAASMGSPQNTAMAIDTAGVVLINSTSNWISPSFKFMVANGRSCFTGASEQFSIGLQYNTGAPTPYIGAGATGVVIISNSSGAPIFAVDPAGNTQIYGTLSKSAGSFKIDHPLPEMAATHDLVHSFVEGPRADLIYRGRATLAEGFAEVDLDADVGMSPGTFALLCRDAQAWVQNDDGWTQVKGAVDGGVLSLWAQDLACTDRVSWLVVAERQDKAIKASNMTDDEGHVILEPLKPPAEEARSV